MARDDALRQLFADVAAQSDGRLTFRAATSTEVGDEFDLQVARSTNPLYVFELVKIGGERQKYVAFTLSLDGDRRPATRAEALGKTLAETDGRLFDANPFLLVYDYSGDRILAVPAVDLFGAFAQHTAGRTLPYSGSSSFSLTPNFQRETIYMYAELTAPTIWAASTKPDEFSVDGLITFLERVASATTARSGEIGQIIAAIKARLAAAPADESGSAVASQARTEQVIPDFASLDASDEEIQIDDRLWRIILAAISSSSAVILVGPPGTGKSALVRKAVGTISTERMARGLPGVREPIWATPDESWTSRELVGGETVAEGEIVFRPGWVLRAIAEDRWLILDEANRGDLDRIFGALLTWLAGGEVTVGIESSAEDASVIELGWTSGVSRVETVERSGDTQPGKIRYLASRDEWKLLGTYNALDSQRVFRIGAALGRRFVRVPIPPVEPDDFDRILLARGDGLAPVLVQKVGLLYRAHYESEVTRVGPALFLGMCSYLRTALAMHPDNAGGEEGTRGSALVEESQTRRGDVIEADLARERDDQDFLDAIVGEAYVLNLGTVMAQLEEPDFAALASRIQASVALSQREVEWVSQMIRALA